AAADIGGVAPEAQNEEPDGARAEHEGVDDHADAAFLTVERERPGPQLPLVPDFLLQVEVERLVTQGERVGEGRAGEGHTRRERRRFELAVPDVGDYTPFLRRVLGYDHGARGGVELARCLEQDVAHEAMQVRLARGPLKIAA